MNTSAWEIHNLALLVIQIMLDRKLHLTDDAVHELQEILTALQMTQNMPLVSDKDVPRFVSDVKEALGHLY